MCLNPIRAEHEPGFGKPKIDREGNIALPCGKCTECLSLRARDWAQRSEHEMSLYEDSSVLTLTYDEQNLQSDEIIYGHFQEFLNRYRAHVRRKKKIKIQHITACEYGSKTFRPHFHSFIFGHIFDDLTYLKTTPKGTDLFTSMQLSKLWTKGFHTIGFANPQSAFYIAAYALKGKSHTHLDPISGELKEYTDFMRSSNRPGIGRRYFFKNFIRLATSGERLPRYYQKLLKTHCPNLFEKYKAVQLEKMIHRDLYQLHAKYITDQQKISNSEFRSAPSENSVYTQSDRFIRNDYNWQKQRNLENVRYKKTNS